MKCRDYETFSVLCQHCDIKDDVQCCKKFDFDKPKKYISVERTDNMRCCWNECPTCGQSIGYHPKNKDFRCPKCNQKILW